MNIGHVSMYYGTYEEVAYANNLTAEERLFYVFFKEYLGGSSTKGFVIDVMPFFGGVNVHDYYVEKSIVMIVRP